MVQENPDKQTGGKEKQLCQCGNPMETKTIQVGWGSAPIEICTNPACPERKKKKKRGAGWCN